MLLWYKFLLHLIFQVTESQGDVVLLDREKPWDIKALVVKCKYHINLYFQGWFCYSYQNLCGLISSSALEIQFKCCFYEVCITFCLFKKASPLLCCWLFGLKNHPEMISAENMVWAHEKKQAPSPTHAVKKGISKQKQTVN